MLDWDIITKIIENLKNLFTIIAVIVGGLWAYYNYFKGRIYKTRLELQIDGQFLQNMDSIKIIIISYQLKNVGLSQVFINQEGSAIRIFSYDTSDYDPGFALAEWNDFTTLPIFQDHRWIESGETIEEQQLINLPRQKKVALKLILRIVSGDRLEWNAIKIIPVLEEDTMKFAQQKPEDNRVTSDIEKKKKDLEDRIAKKKEEKEQKEGKEQKKPKDD